MKFSPWIYLLLIAISISQFIFSCQKKDDKSNTKNSSTPLLESIEIFEIFVSEKSAFKNVNQFDIIELDEECYLYYYDGYSNEIYIYNFTDKHPIKIISIDHSGPNGVIPNRTNLIKLKSLDTFLIYERSIRKLSMFNNETKLFDIKLDDITNHTEINTYEVWQPSLSDNFYFIDSSVYFTIHQYLSHALHSQRNSKENNTVLLIDLRNNSVQSYLKVPQIYKKGFWGTQTAVLTSVFQTYDKVNKKFLYSFSADNRVYYFEDGQLNSFDASSYYFNKVIPVNRRNKSVSKELSWEHTMTNPYFTKILYDFRRNLIYRLANLGINKQDYKKGKKEGPFSILIFDLSYNKLGEFLFDSSKKYDHYNPFYLFIGPDGIYIPRKDLYTANPNSFYFEIFRFKNQFN